MKNRLGRSALGLTLLVSAIAGTGNNMRADEILAVTTHITGGGGSAASPIDHPALNGNRRAMLWITQVREGVDNPPEVGVSYDGSRWAVINWNGQALPAGVRFDLFIGSGSVHEAAPVTLSQNFTLLSHPQLDGHPAAMVQVTPHFAGDYASIVHRPYGVWYTGAQWSVFCQDRAPMREGSTYNVYVGGDFVWSARRAGSWYTTIDDPLTNGRPEAKLLVTQNFQPYLIYNDHPIGVFYDNGSGRWNIYNKDGAGIPADASFNVAVFFAPRITTQPAGTTALAGESARLEVVVESPRVAPPRYEWYQGEPGDTGTPVGANAATLVTPPLFADTSYWVRAVNAYGSIDSSVARVSIGVPPAGPVLTSVYSRRARPGSPVTLTGTGFSSAAAQNRIDFGALSVAAQRVTANTLKARLPRRLARGSTPVRVVVNGVPSNTILFDVR